MRGVLKKDKSHLRIQGFKILMLSHLSVFIPDLGPHFFLSGTDFDLRDLLRL